MAGVRLPVPLFLAALALLGSAASATAAPSVLTFDDAAHSVYALDSEGTDDNEITLSVDPGTGRVLVTDSAGITDATTPEDRCTLVSPTSQSCAASGTQDAVASWTLTPSAGTNSLRILSAASAATPPVRAIDVVRYSGGSGCDSARGDEVTGVTIGFVVDPGPAPTLCVQSISTPPTDGAHDITLEASPGRNVVTGGPGRHDRLILSGFPEPGLQVTEDGLANDGEKSDPDDSYSRTIDVYELSAFGDSFAGDGDVRSGDGDDHLTGGAGDDRLDPGGGADTIHAGAGDDLLVDTPGADLLDGGEGTLDAITYGAYLPGGPLALSLDGVANDGRAGEGDNLLDVEWVTGGPQADVITGGPTANFLFGGDGDDRIDGGLGADLLRGNHGDDVLVGRDLQLQRDDLGCGDGPDDAAVADAGDLVASDCERLDRAPAPAAPAPTPSPLGTPRDTTAPTLTVAGVPRRLTKGTLRRRGVTISIAVSEPASLEVRLLGRPRSATLSAVRDLVLGETRVTRGAGTHRVRVRAVAALLGRGSRFKVRLVVVATDAAGNPRSVRRTIRVAPRR